MCIRDSDYDDVMYGEGYFTLLKDREVTVKPRTDYQANYIREEEDYFQELSAKLVAEESAIEEAQRTKLMLMEYTDKETIQSVQTALNEAGYDCGTPDGIAGKMCIRDSMRCDTSTIATPCSLSELITRKSISVSFSASAAVGSSRISSRQS